MTAQRRSAPLIRAAAAGLFQSQVRADDRVLVTGAGGWFGRTVAALLHECPAATLFVTQHPRRVDYSLGEIDAVRWEHGLVDAFDPTIVIDCAFILRDYIPDMTPADYVYANTVLTGRLLSLTARDAVRVVVSVSSGAAVHPVDATSSPLEANPYGYLKRQAELAVQQAGAEFGTTVVVARPWSVTGSLVTRPERYAFSNLIMQAHSDTLRIEAPHKVWRRFVGVDDFFAVALGVACSRGGGVVDSAGELVEFDELARRIVSVTGSQAMIVRAEATGGRVDEYFPDEESWLSACDSVGYSPASLDEQIAAVDRILRERS